MSLLHAPSENMGNSSVCSFLDHFWGRGWIGVRFYVIVSVKFFMIVNMLKN